MILFHLDMKGLQFRGSACQSGSIRPSHVLAEMFPEADLKKPSLRISFSQFNTKMMWIYLCFKDHLDNFQFFLTSYLLYLLKKVNEQTVFYCSFYF
jgi:hypothetical protein